MPGKSKPCSVCGEAEHAFEDNCVGWPSAEDIRVIADDEGGKLRAASEQAIYRVAHRLEALEEEVERLRGKPVSTTTQGSMLDLLGDIEMSTLPGLLGDPSVWNTLDVDYEPPRVERLWAQLGESRLYLHRIHPCAPGEALYHPHPWPSAVHLVLGSYEMALGYNRIDDTPPPHAATLIVQQGSRYEMLDPFGWHYVRPLTGECLSVMLAGKPFSDTSARKPNHKLWPLTDHVKRELLDHFAVFFPRST